MPANPLSPIASTILVCPEVAAQSHYRLEDYGSSQAANPFCLIYTYYIDVDPVEGAPCPFRHHQDHLLPAGRQ